MGRPQRNTGHAEETPEGYFSSRIKLGLDHSRLANPSQAQWCTPVSQRLGRLKKEDPRSKPHSAN